MKNTGARISLNELRKDPCGRKIQLETKEAKQALDTNKYDRISIVKSNAKKILESMS